MSTRRAGCICVLAIVGCTVFPDNVPSWALKNTSDGGSSGNDGGSAGGDDGGTTSDDSGGTGDDAGGGGDSGGGSDSGKPSNCTYPSGPYGTKQGDVLSPSLSWQGYAPSGGSTLTTVGAKDLFDCDGTKHINALVFDESATWCGACQQEAQQVPGWMAGSWGTDGVVMVTLMIQDASQAPATTQTALDWRNQFGETMIWVVADPNFSFASQGQNGLPTNILVDPRTMKIQSVVQGYGGQDPAVDQLALQNKH